MINLGDEVKDTVTGFKGIATGVSEFLHGCRRICVTPKMNKDGTLGEAQWFDEPQIAVVKAKVILAGSRTTGGPMPNIPTRNIGK